MAAPRAHKQEPEVEEHESAPTGEIAQLNTPLELAFTGLHLHLDKVSAQVESLSEEIHGPHDTRSTNEGDQPKPTRRRSLDEMQAAMRRLLSPELRPLDDDSPQVIQDAIAETIALRQLIHDLMQSMTSGYQHGLTALRDMTNR